MIFGDKYLHGQVVNHKIEGQYLRRVNRMTIKVILSRRKKACIKIDGLFIDVNIYIAIIFLKKLFNECMP